MGIEVYEPYAREAENKRTHDKIIIGNLMQVLLEPKSFDAAVALDVIEHFNKSEGCRLIDRMEECATKRIVIYTPNGWYEQHGKDGNPFQSHKSAWNVKDFYELGFKVFGCGGHKKYRSHTEDVREPKYKQFLADLSQRYVYNNPKDAFALIAIRDII